MVHPHLPIGYGMLTDAGVKRNDQPNEDTVHAFQGVSKTSQQFSLFVVADGMGGHSNGKEASALAVKELVDFLYPQLSSRGAVNEEFGRALLVAAVQRANDAVYQKNQETFNDSGTTMTAVLIVDTVTYIANVGDSRTYLWRWTDRLRQVTTDHSLVARLVATNVLKPVDVYTHPQRNQIYRSLGKNFALDVDIFVVPLQEGDRVLLCSDGLWEMVRDQEIDKILFTAPTPEIASKQLLDTANGNGGEDNVSVIVAQVLPPESQATVSGVRGAEETSLFEPTILSQCIHAGRHVLFPLAACVRVWCLICGFLLLMGLPWLCLLPSKMYSLLQKAVLLDDDAPAHFHLVPGCGGNTEIVYHYMPDLRVGDVQLECEPIGSGWEWALY